MNEEDFDAIIAAQQEEINRCLPDLGAAEMDYRPLQHECGALTLWCLTIR